METRKKIKSSPADKVFTVCNTIFMILFIIITLCYLSYKQWVYKRYE